MNDKVLRHDYKVCDILRGFRHSKNTTTRFTIIERSEKNDGSDDILLKEVTCDSPALAQYDDFIVDSSKMFAFNNNDSSIFMLKIIRKTMTLDDLANIIPAVKVCDILHFFLLGKDVSLQLNLVEYDIKNFDHLNILSHEKVTSSAWEPYYEDLVNEIFISEDSDGFFPTLAIRRYK